MSFFSPEKVDALIPVLAPLVEELWQKRRDLAIVLLEQDPQLRPMSGRAGAPTQERRGQSRRATELKAELVRIINRIEAYGCLIKDFDLGLLDFPAMRDGRPIFLCWKSGETSVTHWHGTDEISGNARRSERRAD